MEKLFAVSAPGLEPFTALELKGLGLLAGKVDSKANSSGISSQQDDKAGGIEFEGGLESIYRANLYLRTASRVLVRLGDFYAAAFAELRKKAARLAWEKYLIPGRPVNLRVTCHKSKLYHSDAVAERVAGAIGDRLGKPPQLNNDSDESDASPAQVVVVRLAHDHCEISIDSSGGLLHRRGYRLATAKAPLRETLAAGIILASGWETGASLLDPFCGSGTIAIEAAMMARGIAPGFRRQFAFMNWPGFDRRLWESLLAENEQEQQRRARDGGEVPWIAASDRDAGAIELARANAGRAGVVENIEFSCRAVSAIEPRGLGWVVTNPPYGLRVSATKDLRNLYAQFGKVLRLKCPGWRVAVLCNDRQLLKQMGLALDASLSLVNGGVAVRLAQGKILYSRTK